MDGYVYMLFGIVIGFIISSVHMLCMLPHNHFAIAGIVVVLIAMLFFPGAAFSDVFLWAVTGGILSAAVDLDVYALVILKSPNDVRLKKYANPLEIYKNFESFMDLIFETGLWRAVLITHLAFSAIIIVLFYFYLGAYLVPAILAVAMHLVCDLPNLRRAATR